ncbi:BaiN/RdsA family NAD(P)/FAD-dependent oxidoreductase [Azohydromonas caseinilytica]|uniref:TIGR03862 family flavoprotein n=1 Tax=Azohydromonas caseinilytica TaxID=2728836 RepID=A0A848F6W9_9BURK|nr:TIGR03862 family flavoprotein [Azohydromonas caseinilytica]NML14466.1 TIGR03862 family flavoprotein [Azohydromonas caseinilytica]
MSTPPDSAVAVVGAGPAGLMAAERLAQAGLRVEVFDAMPSVGRKFLLAGKGGMNLTHSEPFERFVGRYGARRAAIEPMLRRFDADALRRWAAGLGIATFVGSSGRVFPTDMKAAPLLRAWLQRLRALGVVFHMRHRWVGWADEAAAPGSGALPPPLLFETPQGRSTVQARAVVLALGGASWPRLGSDGAWVPLLAQRGVDVAPLQPANCGFDVGRIGPDGTVQEGWSEFLRSRFAGTPLKTVVLRFEDGARRFEQRGEFVLTESGVEGSLVYAASSVLREALHQQGRAVPTLDLLPDRDAAFVAAEVARPRGARSLSTHLKSRLNLDGAKAALLHELLPKALFAPGADPAPLAAAIKALPLPLIRPRPIAEAISSAGGVRFEALEERSKALRALPGVWCAGEMLDWEAPTGGYLLTACFASGCAAAEGVIHALQPAS